MRGGRGWRARSEWYDIWTLSLIKKLYSYPWGVIVTYKNVWPSITSNYGGLRPWTGSHMTQECCGLISCEYTYIHIYIYVYVNTINISYLSIGGHFMIISYLKEFCDGYVTFATEVTKSVIMRLKYYLFHLILYELSWIFTFVC